MEKMKKGDLAGYRKSLSPAKNEITISMGTCGIAAGSEKIYGIFEQELKDKGLEHVKLKKTGCLGLCFCEPNLSVKVEGMPEIFYGNVDEKAVHDIISEHVIKKHMVNNNVIFMPSRDTGKNIFTE